MVERWDPPDLTIVTGAGGWLGRTLLGELRDPTSANHRPGRVRALVHHADEARALAEIDGVDVIVGDVAAPSSLDPVFADLHGTVDIIHAAGVIHPGRVAAFYRVNATGTRNVVAAAAAGRVRRLVHVSSNSPFGTNPQPLDVFRTEEPYNPYMGYGISKMLAEQFVGDAAEEGLDTVVVRPPWFYGPNQPPRQTTFFTLVRRGRFPVVGDGAQRRSMVYVPSLVDGIVAAELTPAARGRAYWIADERPYPLGEIVDTVRRALAEEGFHVADRTTRLPGVVGRLARAADGLLQRAGRYQQQLHVLGELGETIACDISSARGELGYVPRASLYEGMRASIRWCIAEGLAIR